MRWRALPIVTVLAIATVMFWGLVTVFGSESSDEADLPLVTAADSSDDLPRIPLVFPEVSKPMIEALPSPEPSPEPPATATAAKKPATTKARAVTVPTDGTTGNATTGESGDATIGPNNSTPAGGDDSDPVGDLDDDDFGPDEPDDESEPPEPPDPEPEEDDEPSGNGGLSSGDSGNNGADGSSETQSDPGNSEDGDED
ncbi:MAG: hypothetical protein WD627_09315 [Actinomycetota bacterium]